MMNGENGHPNGGAGNGQKAPETRGEGAEVISYLVQLGLEDGDLAKVVSLLRASSMAPLLAADPEPGGSRLPSSLLQAMEGQDLLEGAHGQESSPATAAPAQETTRDTITLYLAEEQRMLKEAYESFFSGHPTIRVLGSSSDTSSDSLIEAAATLKPQVLLLGIKTVQPETVEKLELLREACPRLGLVLLFWSFYDLQGIKALRRYSRTASAGCAYLLKHTIDTVDQLTQVISSVAQGRVTLDPLVMEELVRTGETTNSFLKELSPKELEVLRWMARGYRNATIADILGRDRRAVERHINNIYSKMQGANHAGDSRVAATLMYLRATGLLQTEESFLPE